MTGNSAPDHFKDDFRLRLQKVIEERVRSKKVVQDDDDEDERPPEGSATNVIDFAELLKRSLAKKDGKPAGKTTKKAAKKASKKKAAKKSKKKTTTRKAG